MNHSAANIKTQQTFASLFREQTDKRDFWSSHFYLLSGIEHKLSLLIFEYFMASVQN